MIPSIIYSEWEWSMLGCVVKKDQTPVSFSNNNESLYSKSQVIETNNEPQFTVSEPLDVVGSITRKSNDCDCECSNSRSSFFTCYDSEGWD